MPGPASQRKIPDIKAAIESGKLTEQVIDERVLAVLRLVKQAGKFENPEELEEQAIDRPEDRALIRKAGAEGAVLLKNENGTLPLRAKKVKSIALLGLAKECLAHGGGSASVNCHYKITPYEAFRSRLGNGVDLTYSEGMTYLIPSIECCKKLTISKGHKHSVIFLHSRKMSLAKMENPGLHSVASKLRTFLESLKASILVHKAGGCQMEALVSQQNWSQNFAPLFLGRTTWLSHPWDQQL